MSPQWDWETGWPSDVGDIPVREATPAQWAQYTRDSSARDSILVVNQLSANLSMALGGLAAHKAAGTAVSFVELGNEMYDSTRADVVAEYPDGTAYARKMQTWTAAVKKEHPQASVALLAMTWRPGISGREAAWNKQVFQADSGLSSAADAATLHPYFGIQWSAPTPGDPKSLAASVAHVLASPFEFISQNVAMLGRDVPARLRLWVTEVSAYGAAEINYTWLEALVNVLFETLLLLELPQVDILTPYCVVCGDPIAPNLASPTPKNAHNDIVPPAEAGKVEWKQTLRSAAHELYFSAVAAATAAGASSDTSASAGAAPGPFSDPLFMEQLLFAPENSTTAAAAVTVPAASVSAQCGVVGIGASGAFLAKDTACATEKTVAAAACCCSHRCAAAHPGCAAWQLISETAAADFLVCYLKSSPEMSANGGSISGVAAPTPPPPPPPPSPPPPAVQQLVGWRIGRPALARSSANANANANANGDDANAKLVTRVTTAGVFLLNLGSASAVLNIGDLLFPEDEAEEKPVFAYRQLFPEAVEDAVSPELQLSGLGQLSGNVSSCGSFFMRPYSQSMITITPFV